MFISVWCCFISLACRKSICYINMTTYIYSRFFEQCIKFTISDNFKVCRSVFLQRYCNNMCYWLVCRHNYLSNHWCVSVVDFGHKNQITWVVWRSVYLQTWMVLWRTWTARMKRTIYVWKIVTVRSSPFFHKNI